MADKQLDYVINMTAGNLESLQQLINDLQAFKALVNEGAEFPIRITGTLLERLKQDVRLAVSGAMNEVPSATATAGGALGRGALVGQDAEKSPEGKLIAALNRLSVAIETRGTVVLPGTPGIPVAATPAGTSAGIESMLDRFLAVRAPLKQQATQLGTKRIDDDAQIRSMARELSEVLKFAGTVSDSLRQQVVEAMRLKTRMGTEESRPAAFAKGNEGSYHQTIENSLRQSTYQDADRLFETVRSVLEKARADAERTASRSKGKISAPEADVLARKALNTAGLETVAKSLAERVTATLTTAFDSAIAQMQLNVRERMGEINDDDPFGGRPGGSRQGGRDDVGPLPSRGDKRTAQSVSMRQPSEQYLAAQRVAVLQRELTDAQARKEPQGAITTLEQKLAEARADMAALPPGPSSRGISQKEAGFVLRTRPDSPLAWNQYAGTKALQSVRESVSDATYNRVLDAISQRMTPLVGELGERLNGVTSDDVRATLEKLAPMRPGARGKTGMTQVAPELEVLFKDRDGTTNPMKKLAQSESLQRGFDNFKSTAKQFQDMAVLPHDVAKFMRDAVKITLDGVEQALEEGTALSAETQARVNALKRLPIMKGVVPDDLTQVQGREDLAGNLRRSYGVFRGAYSLVSNAGTYRPEFDAKSGMQLLSGGDSTDEKDDIMGQVYAKAKQRRQLPMTPYTIENELLTQNPDDKRRASLMKDGERLNEYMTATGAAFYEQSERRREAVIKRMAVLQKLYAAMSVSKELPPEFTGFLGQGDTMKHTSFQAWMEDVEAEVPTAKKKSAVRIKPTAYEEVLRALATQMLNFDVETLGYGVVATPDSPVVRRRGVQVGDRFMLATRNEYDQQALREQNRPPVMNRTLFTEGGKDWTGRVNTYGMATVNNESQLGYVLQALAKQSRVSIDTETDPRYKPGQDGFAIRTLQIGLDKAIDGVNSFMIDMEAVSKSSAGMKQLLQTLGSNNILKLAHNVDFEEKGFKSYFGSSLGTNVADTMLLQRYILQATGKYDEKKSPANYENTVSDRLGKLTVLGKGEEQKSFGPGVPITENMARYAATDVLLTGPVLDAQMKALREMKPEQARKALSLFEDPAMARIVAEMSGVGLLGPKEVLGALKERGDKIKLVEDKETGASYYWDELTEREKTRGSTAREEIKQAEWERRERARIAREGGEMRPRFSADAKARGDVSRDMGNVIDRLGKDVYEGSIKPWTEYLNELGTTAFASEDKFKKAVEILKRKKQEDIDRGYTDFATSVKVTSNKVDEFGRAFGGEADVLAAKPSGAYKNSDLKTFRVDKRGRFYTDSIYGPGGYQDQLLNPVFGYSPMMRETVGYGPSEVSIKPVGLKINDKTRQIEDLYDEPEVFLDPAGMGRPMGKLTTAAQKRVNQFTGKINQIDAALRGLQTGEEGLRVEEAARVAKEYGYEKLGKQFSVEETIADLQARRERLVDLLEKAKNWRGKGEIDSLTGTLNTTPSPAVDPVLAAARAGKGPGMVGDFSECCDRIVKAIQSMSREVTMRLNKLVAAGGGIGNNNNVAATVESLAKSGAFDEPTLQRIAKELTIADIGVEAKRRKLMLSRDEQDERRAQRALQNANTYLSANPVSQQTLIDENTVAFRQNQEIYMNRLRASARAVGSASVARDKVGVDSLLLGTGVLSSTEETRLKKRADDVDSLYTVNVMDLARRFVGAGRTDGPFQQTADEGQKYMLAKRAGPQLMALNARMLEQQVQYDALEKETNDVQRAKKARDDALTKFNATQVFGRAIDLRAVRQRDVGQQELATKIADDDEIRKVFAGVGRDLPGATATSGDKSLTSMTALSDKVLKLMGPRMMLTEADRQALMGRIRMSFFDETAPDRSKGFETPTYTPNLERGLAFVSELREQRQGQLLAAQLRLREAKDAVAAAAQDAGVTNVQGTTKDPAFQERQKAATDELARARADIQRLTGVDSPIAQDKFLAANQARLEKYKKTLDDLRKTQDDLFKRLSDLLKQDVRDAKELEDVTNRLQKSFKQLAAATQEAGDSEQGAGGDGGGGKRDFMGGLASKFQSILQYAFAGGVVYSFINKLKQEIAAAVQVEAEGKRLQGILGTKSGVEAQDIVGGAFDAAQATGTNVMNALQMSRIFAQTGRDAPDVQRMTRAALEAQVGAGLEGNQASEFLIAVDNISKGTISSADIIDRISRVESQYAVSARDLSVAIQRAGSLAEQLQPQAQGAVSAIDLIIGSATAVIERTRVSGEQAATSLRFIFSRLLQPEVGRSLQERYGIELGGATPGSMRPLQEILQAVSGKYQELNQSGQTAEASNLLVTFAGARQANAAAALLEDFAKAMDVATTSARAYGDTQQRLALQLDTIQAQYQRLQTSITELFTRILNQSNTASALKRVFGFAADGIDSMGGSTGAFGLGLGLAGAGGLTSLLGSAVGGTATALGGSAAVGTLIAGGGQVLLVLGVLAAAFEALGWVLNKLAGEAKEAIPVFDKLKFSQSEFYKGIQEETSKVGLRPEQAAATMAEVSAEVNAKLRERFGADYEDLKSKQSPQIKQAAQEELLRALEQRVPNLSALGSPEKQLEFAQSMLNNSIKIAFAPSSDQLAKLAQTINDDNATRAKSFDTAFATIGNRLRPIAQQAQGGVYTLGGFGIRDQMQVQKDELARARGFVEQRAFARSVGDDLAGALGGGLKGADITRLGFTTKEGAFTNFEQLIQAAGPMTLQQTLDLMGKAARDNLVLPTDNAYTQRLGTVAADMSAAGVPVTQSALLARAMEDYTKSLDRSKMSTTEFETATSKARAAMEESARIIANQQNVVDAMMPSLRQQYKLPEVAGQAAKDTDAMLGMTDSEKALADAYRQIMKRSATQIQREAERALQGTGLGKDQREGYLKTIGEMTDLQEQLGRTGASSLLKFFDRQGSRRTARERVLEPYINYGTSMGEVRAMAGLQQQFGIDYDPMRAQYDAALRFRQQLATNEPRIVGELVKASFSRMLANGMDSSVAMEGYNDAVAALAEGEGGRRIAPYAEVAAAAQQAKLGEYNETMQTGYEQLRMQLRARRDGLSTLFDTMAFSNSEKSQEAAANLSDSLGDLLTQLGGLDPTTKEGAVGIARIVAQLKVLDKTAMELSEQGIRAFIDSERKRLQAQRDVVNIQATGQREVQLIQANNQVRMLRLGALGTRQPGLLAGQLEGQSDLTNSQLQTADAAYIKQRMDLDRQLAQRQALLTKLTGEAKAKQEQGISALEESINNLENNYLNNRQSIIQSGRSGAYVQYEQARSAVEGQRTQELRQAYDGMITQPLRQLLSSYRNFTTEGLGNFVESIGRAAQDTLVNNFLQQLSLKIEDPIVGAFRQGGLFTKEAIIEGFREALLQANLSLPGVNDAPPAVPKTVMPVSPTSSVVPNVAAPVTAAATAGGLTSYFSKLPGSKLTPEVGQLIFDEANKKGIDPAIAFSMMYQESRFNPKATSPVGAKGLGQLMPDTARGLGLRVDGTVDERTDPKRNIPASLGYLRDQMATFWNVEDALAAYNAGPGTVRKVKRGQRDYMPETKKYVPEILNRANKAKEETKPISYTPNTYQQKDFLDKVLDFLVPTLGAQSAPGRPAGTTGRLSARTLSGTLDLQEKMLGTGDPALFGPGADGLPRYLSKEYFTAGQRQQLRQQGVQSLENLYYNTAGALLYDPKRKTSSATVSSHMVYAPAPLLPGETFDEAERRARSTKYPLSPSPSGQAAIATIDPSARPYFDELFSAAKAKNLKLKVREAARPVGNNLRYFGDGLSHTLTSRHAMGTAIDLTTDSDYRQIRKLIEQSPRLSSYFNPELKGDAVHFEIATEAILKARKRGRGTSGPSGFTSPIGSVKAPVGRYPALDSLFGNMRPISREPLRQSAFSLRSLGEPYKPSTSPATTVDYKNYATSMTQTRTPSAIGSVKAPTGFYPVLDSIFGNMRPISREPLRQSAFSLRSLGEPYKPSTSPATTVAYKNYARPQEYKLPINIQTPTMARGPLGVGSTLDQTIATSAKPYDLSNLGPQYTRSYRGRLGVMSTLDQTIATSAKPYDLSNLGPQYTRSYRGRLGVMSTLDQTLATSAKPNDLSNLGPQYTRSYRGRLGVMSTLDQLGNVPIERATAAYDLFKNPNIKPEKYTVPVSPRVNALVRGPLGFGSTLGEIIGSAPSTASTSRSTAPTRYTFSDVPGPYQLSTQTGTRNLDAFLTNSAAHQRSTAAVRREIKDNAEYRAFLASKRTIFSKEGMYDRTAGYDRYKPIKSPGDFSRGIGAFGFEGFDFSSRYGRRGNQMPAVERTITSAMIAAEKAAEIAATEAKLNSLGPIGADNLKSFIGVTASQMPSAMTVKGPTEEMAYMQYSPEVRQRILARKAQMREMETQRKADEILGLIPKEAPVKPRKSYWGMGKQFTGEWGDFANTALPLVGSLGGAALGNAVAGKNKGSNYAQEGSAMGAMLLQTIPGFQGPIGGMVGGLLGGLVGGLFGKNKDDDVQTEALQKIERNTREAVKAFENQTALLQLDSRFLNVPAGFTVPEYRPFRAGSFNAGVGGDVVGLEGRRNSLVYNNNATIEVTVNTTGGTDPRELADQVASAIQQQLNRAGSSFDARSLGVI